MQQLKKILTFMTLIFVLLSNFQIGVLYADSLTQLKVEKDKSIAVLQKVEKVIDVAVDKIDNSLKTDGQKERLGDKNEEIKDYIDGVEEKIESEKSKSDVQNIVAEAKKVIVLKVVSGITEYDSVEDNLPSEIARDQDKKEEALEIIQESMEGEKGGDYLLIIKTKYSQLEVKSLFSKFDGNIGVDFMYDDEGSNTFEIAIPDDSLFKQEMLEEIESGIMPESFLGMEIVQPEVFSIFSEDVDLGGENISQTWGIEHYNTPSYLQILQEKSQEDDFKRIRVGVIDTGIDYNHSDLKGRVLDGKDFVNKDDDAMDDQGHGTHVSGTIGASINGGGIIGVNPFVDFVPIKICTKRGFCPSYAVLRALEYTKDEKIDVLNMSLGGRGNPKTNPICEAIASNVEAGVIVISASGNSNIDTSKFVPGGCETAITVAAIDKNMDRAGFSNFGNNVDVSAPGVKVYSSLPNNNYRELSGTSMATPHIVGLVSIMKTFKPGLDQESVRSLLKEFPIDVSTDGGKNIASAVDVGKLISFLNKPQTIVEDEREGILEGEEKTEKKVEKVVDEKIEDKGKTTSEYEVLLEGEISTKTVQIFENQKEEDLKINNFNKQLEEEALEKNKITAELENIAIEINAFESEGLEINSNNYTDDGTGSIVMKLVSPIESGDYIGDKSYDENGKILDETRINSSEEDLGATEGQLLPNNFTQEDLYDFGAGNILEEEREDSGVNISNVKDDTEVFISTEDIFLDGAEKGIEINSVGKENLTSIEFDEYSSGSTDSSIRPINFIGDDGEAIILTQDDFIHSEGIIEELGDIEHTDELIIDNAEKGVEINSMGDDHESDTLEFLNLDNLDTSGLVEVGNPGNSEDINEEELIKSEIIDGVPDNIITNTEFFVEGAQKPEGVEINSFGDEEPSEENKMFIPEFSEDAIEVFTGSVLGEETVLDINDEDAKILEEKFGGLDDEIITEIEEFDDNQLQASISAENNPGIEINNLEEEENFTVELSDQEEAELESLYSNTELIEGTIQLESQSFDASSIIEYEEESTGIEINSFGEEETINEFIDVELTAEQEAELEEAFPSSEDTGVTYVTFDKWSDDDNVDDIEGSDMTISDLDYVNHGGIEINSFGNDEITEVPNTEEAEDDLEEVILDEEKIKTEAEEIYISDEDVAEHEAGLSAEELSDDRGEDEIIFDESLELEQLGDTGEEGGSSIGIQNTYYCDVYVGEYCNYRFYRSRNYKKVNSNSSISYVGASKRRIYVYGKKIGKNSITWYDSRNNKTVTVHTNVKSYPQPFSKTYYLTQGKDFTLNLSNANRYSYSYSNGGRNIFSAYTNSSTVTLKAHKAGIASVYIRSNGRHVGTIRAVVNVPRYYATIKSGETYVRNLSWANGHKYTTSNSNIANIAVGRNYFSVSGKAAGKAYITVRDYRGNHKFNMTITVTPPPVITKTITAGEIYAHGVKRPASYKYYFSDSRLADLRTGGKYNYYLYTKSSGTLYTKVVDRRGRHQYTLKLIIKPVPIISATTYVGEIYKKPLSQARSYKYSISNSSIASVESSRSYFNVITQKAGIVYVTVNNYSGYPQYTLKLTVKSPPKPKEYTVNVGQKQWLNFYFANKQEYKIYRSSTNGGHAWAYNNNGYVKFYGHTYGKAQYKIYGKYHLYTLNVNIVPKVETVNTELYNTKTICHYTGKNTTFTTKNGGNINVNRYSKGLCFQGKKAGKTEVYVKDRGFNIKTFKINIKAVPVPKTYHITVGDGKYTNVYVPTKNGQIYYFTQASSGGYIGAWQYGNRVSIKGSKHGKTTLKVYDKTHGLHYYTIEVNVAPKPPIIYTYEVYEGKSIGIRHSFGNNTNFSQSNSLISYSKNYYGILINGKKSGTTNLYNKDSRGAVTHIYKMKVIKKPEVKTFNYTIQAGYGQNIIMPENIDSYKIFTTNKYLLYKNELPYSKNLVRINAHDVGNMKVHIQQYIGGYYWEKYTLNVSIVPSYENYTLTLGDKKSVSFNDRYEVSEDNSNIANLHYGSSGRQTMQGIGTGKTQWKIYIRDSKDKKILRKVYNITVAPQPKIIKKTCTTTVGNSCSLYVDNSGYKYSTDVSMGYYSVDSYKDKLRVKSDRTGTFTFYLKAQYGNYYTHEFTTKFTPKAAKVVDCEIMVGGVCNLGFLRSIHRFHEFGYTKEGLTELNYTRYTSSHKDLTKNVEDKSIGIDYKNVEGYQRYLLDYSIKGIKEGKTSIYMYDEGDHLVTINVVVHKKIDFKFEDRTLSTYQSNKIGTKILSGGGDYDHVQTYKNVTGTDPIYKLDYLDIDSDKDEDGIYLQTGEVKLEEEEAGNYDVEITDRFGQRKQLALTVKDTTLALSEYEVNMSGYKDYLVEKYQSYGDIQSVAPSDDKVSAQLVELKDGSQAVYIKMNKPGRSIITVTDENPHFTQPTDGSKPKSKAIRTINVYSHERYKDIATDEVVEEVVEEETTSGKIRYIRDWLHGSNRNNGNHWVELQAFDKKGNNVAEGKNPTTKTSFNYAPRPYSRLTDGILTGSMYASGGEGLNYVQVDLGKVYDIEKVKVWHYYPDGGSGRIYNGTKTEVSVDGKNWTVLFDSAVSGTYVEPKDGSGRSYDVEEIGNTDFFSNVTYGIEKQDGFEIPFLNFNILENIKEVGIVYKTNEGTLHREKLDITSDNKYYTTFIGTKTEGAYSKSTPYIITNDGELVYYSEKVEYGFLDSELKIANANNETKISISSAIYTSDYNQELQKFRQESNSYSNMDNYYWVAQKQGTADAIIDLIESFSSEDIDFTVFKKLLNSKRKSTDPYTEKQTYYGDATLYRRDVAFEEDIENFKQASIIGKWNDLDSSGELLDSQENYLKSYLGISAYFLSESRENQYLKSSQYDSPNELGGMSLMKKKIISTLNGYSNIKGENSGLRCQVGGIGKFHNAPDNSHCVVKRGVDYDLPSDVGYIVDAYDRDAWMCNDGFSEHKGKGTCIDSREKKKEINEILGMIEQDVEKSNESLVHDDFDGKEFAKGVAQGGYQALEDYVVTTIDVLSWTELLELAKSLKELKIADLQKGVDDLVAETEELIILVENIGDILDEIPDITTNKKGYYTGYLGVTVGIELVPALKPVKVLRKSLNAKVGKDFNFLITNKDSWCSLTGLQSVSEGNTYIATKSCKRAEDKKSGKDIKIPSNYKEQITGRMFHVMQLDWHFSGKYNGMHSLNKLKDGDYKFEYLTNNANKDKNTSPYGGKLLIKDENGVFQEKKTNKGMSSFFPDSWDEKRIQEEVEYALKKHEGHIPGKKENEGVWGWSKSEPKFKIQIQMAKDKNGDMKISSFYPIFDN